MLDELQRLGECAPLQMLLAHYAERGKPDREAWQDRLNGLEGQQSREMIRLHGELLAYGWIEQNTGVTPTPMPKDGGAPACYRVTSTGLRALRQVRLAVV